MKLIFCNLEAYWDNNVTNLVCNFCLHLFLHNLGVPAINNFKYLNNLKTIIYKDHSQINLKLLFNIFFPEGNRKPALKSLYHLNLLHLQINILLISFYSLKKKKEQN